MGLAPEAESLDAPGDAHVAGWWQPRSVMGEDCRYHGDAGREDSQLRTDKCTALLSACHSLGAPPSSSLSGPGF